MHIKDRLGQLAHAEYPDYPRWKGFVFWWLSANGYDFHKSQHLVEFVDGNRDGGIDVVAWPLENQSRTDLLILQSKFYKKQPTETELARFKNAIDAIRGSEHQFQDWLATCREELHSRYRKVREQRARCRFLVISPCSFSASSRRALARADIELHDRDYLGNLERNFIAGRSPRLDEIRIRTTSPVQKIATSKETSVYIFVVAAKEMGRLFEKHGNLLFAGNIRYALRGQTANRVRKGLLTTLETHPDELVFSHNGITITGNSLTKGKGALHLQSATIVNGAQTVSYLGHPKMMKELHKSEAQLLVKFISVRDARLLNEIESKVAFRSNNQNKVDPSDLMIDLPSLVSLQRHFRRNGFHLERKKGEQKIRYGEPSLSKERLAQVLAAIGSTKGAVRAKSKQELFEESAHELFSDYDSSNEARNEALTWARVDQIVRYSLSGFANKRRSKRAQTAQFAVLTALHASMKMAGVKTKFIRSSARWDKNSEAVTWFVSKSAGKIVAALLRISGQEKKNEPAFYKSAESVHAAVNKAARKVKKLVREYYQEEIRRA